MIFQTCTSECGLACLAMIAAYYGKRIDLTTLREQFGPQTLGMTLESLLRAGERLDLASRLYRVEPRDLRLVRKPAILHWSFCHFVVLIRIRGDRLYIHDPARGAVVHTFEEVSPYFTGLVAELTPTQRFTRGSGERAVRLWDMLRAASDQKGRMSLLLLFALMSQAFALISPYYFRLVIDGVLPRRDLPLLYYVGAIFFALALAEWIAGNARIRLNAHLGAILNASFAAALFRHMMRLPVEFFESRDSSNLAAKIDSMREVREIFTEELPRLLVSALAFVTTLLILSTYSAVLTALVTAVLAAYFIFRAVTYGRFRLHFEDAFVKRSHNSAFFLDSVRGIASIKAYGAEPLRTARWRQLVAESTRSEYHAAVSMAELTLVRDRTTQLEGVTSLFVGAHFIMLGEMTIGMIMAYFLYKRIYWESGQTIIDVTFRLRLAQLHLDRLSDILLQPEETAYRAPALLPARFAGNAPKIVAREVQYALPGSRTTLFRPVSFEIDHGERVAIVGRSGAGKTTLVHLLLGLRSGYQGTIVIGDRELTSIPRDQWLGRLAVVLQGQQLLTGTIRENICFGSVEADDDRMLESADHACIHERIAMLPMQYESMIGEIGQLLSAGEVQRILIARALYRSTPILILDEGTANLDPDTERRVLANLQRLNKTVLHATHRTQVIQDATRIVRLESTVVSN